MRFTKICLTITLLLSAFSITWAQSYQPGQKVQVLDQNSWKDAVIVKYIVNRANAYQVRLSPPNNGVLSVGKEKIRLVGKAKDAKDLTIGTTNDTNIKLGRYELFSGIPSMSLGHFILQPDGTYKVAFNDQEADYEIGTYRFNPSAQTIEWLTGLFRNNGWGGKLEKKGNGNNRIVFNKVTYAESY